MTVRSFAMTMLAALLALLALTSSAGEIWARRLIDLNAPEGQR